MEAVSHTNGAKAINVALSSLCVSSSFTVNMHPRCVYMYGDQYPAPTEGFFFVWASNFHRCVFQALSWNRLAALTDFYKCVSKQAVK